MIINYDIQKLNKVFFDFYNSTGINMDLLKADFSFVGNKSFWKAKRYCEAIQSTEKGRKACLCSDQKLFKASRESRKTEMHICHAGLIDATVPIIYNDEIIGYIVFGQMKADTDFSALKDYVAALGLSENDMKKYYSEISHFNADKIKSIASIAEIIVKYVLLENMLKPDFDDAMQKAISYIDANLDNPLTVQSISKHINLSKSVLYRRFHSCFNCTVNEYINKKRIEKAIDILLKNDFSVEETARYAGFSSGSYFSKLFKKEKGISPLKYKKKIKGE